MMLRAIILVENDVVFKRTAVMWAGEGAPLVVLAEGHHEQPVCADRLTIRKYKVTRTLPDPRRK